MILRISLATASLLACSTAFSSEKWNEESAYNAFQKKTDPYWKPTVHMNDSDEVQTLHAASREPAADPFLKQQAYDLTKKKRTEETESVLTPSTHKPQPVVDGKVPFQYTYDQMGRPALVPHMEEGKHVPDYAYWATPSQPRDYSIFQATQPQPKPEYAPHVSLVQPLPYTEYSSQPTGPLPPSKAQYQQRPLHETVQYTYAPQPEQMPFQPLPTTWAYPTLNYPPVQPQMVQQAAPPTALPQEISQPALTTVSKDQDMIVYANQKVTLSCLPENESRVQQQLESAQDKIKSLQLQLELAQNPNSRSDSSQIMTLQGRQHLQSQA